MAKIKTESKELEVNDGESIIKACEELGVPFGCYVGTCGSCKIGVTEGSENLSEVTGEEKALVVNGNIRLACQCRINKGEIKIKF